MAEPRGLGPASRAEKAAVLVSVAASVAVAVSVVLGVGWLLWAALAAGVPAAVFLCWRSW